MGEIHFIPEVVEARPKSSMRHFASCMGLLISSRMQGALCVVHYVSPRMCVHLSLLNVHGFSGPFCIVFLLSFQTECHHPIIIGSMLYLCCLFFHPLSVFV
jgi:hypothetical protein